MPKHTPQKSAPLLPTPAPEAASTVTPPFRKRVQGQHATPEETAREQDIFLKTFANTANARASAQQAGVDYKAVWRWKEHDTEFALKYQEAEKLANDLLFGEAWRRAMIGEEETVISMGKIVYKEIPVLDHAGNQVMKDGKPVTKRGEPLTIRRKSDRLIELMLKARIEAFRDKGVTINNFLPKEYMFDPTQDGSDR